MTMGRSSIFSQSFLNNYNKSVWEARRLGRKRVAFGTRKIGVIPAKALRRCSGREKSDCATITTDSKMVLDARAPAFCGGYLRIADHSS
jgi:hypothetical protein